MDETEGRSRLEAASKQYWADVRDVHGGRMRPAMDEYVGRQEDLLGGKSLLQAELGWAACQDGCLPIPRPGATLVLLVGFSPEPLLQAICAYRPHAILLVLNEKYGNKNGRQFGAQLLEAIGTLSEHQLLTSTPEIIRPDPSLPGIIVGDTPEKMFAGLVAALRERNDIILDITGGKKSMVTGAFLYATFANCSISYVDFGAYDPIARRPLGYTCSIGELANPYEKFSLRDWERVRTLYQTYRFQEACALIESSIAAAFGAYLPQSETALSTLVMVLRCYAAWESGDHTAALGLATDIKKNRLCAFVPPTAVTALGPHWTHQNDRGELDIGVRGLYGDWELLPIYIRDELARICRAIFYNHDYRTGFLRAGSLNEVIMLARLVRMADEKNKKALLDALDVRTPPAEDVFETLWHKKAADIIVVGKPKRKDADIRFSGVPDITICVAEEMSRWWVDLQIFGEEATGWIKFIHTRNDLTHKYSSVPKAWAEAAFAFVTANADDFLKQTSYAQPVETHIWDWQTLCTAVELHQWLPPNLLRGKDKACDEPLPARR